MDGSVRDNATEKRFELEVAGETVFALYRRHGGDLMIRHVEAPPRLRGTGAAGTLMRGIVDIARAEGRRIVPLCGYAAAWLRRHKDLVD
jgi:predicted GNAT family acetyltransferase